MGAVVVCVPKVDIAPDGAAVELMNFKVVVGVAMLRSGKTMPVLSKRIASLGLNDGPRSSEAVRRLDTDPDYSGATMSLSLT